MLDKLLPSRAERRRRRKRLRERHIIETSGLFDAQWYASRYPEVIGSGLEPLDHYLMHGARKQFAAGPKFDTRAYLAANPDVAFSPHNPLVHYIQHGAQEGRSFAEVGRAPRRQRRRGPAHEGADVAFSILLQDGARDALDRTLESLRRQVAGTFEVIGASSAARLEQKLGTRAARIVAVASPAPASFLRAAIDAAAQDYVILLDAGDVLEPDALRSLANALADGACDVVYSDEAPAPGAGRDRDPSLKPGWSPELLAAYNYFGRLTAIRRTLAREALPDMAEGTAAEWGLNLRVAQRARRIERLPKVLCRRAFPEADRVRAATHRGDYERVLREHWRRQGREAQVALRADGTFHSTWPLARRPLVSVIIPNKDRAHLLRVCLDGLLQKTDYDPVEIIVVDNGSTQPEALALYREFEARGVRIVPFDEAFNYSRACNLGAAAARGELLLFLNNDIEMRDGGWLDELVRQALQPGVGVVGPKLLYPDGEIQHAGVALGLFTLAAHVFHRAPQDAWSVFGSPDVPRNWTAVTGACQLIHRHVFDLVGGYDEEFLISYSDIVLCASAARAGFRAVYAPRATLIHHEGASRGHTNPSADQVLFAQRLKALGFDADPYFHPALDTESFAPRLRASQSHAVAVGMRGDIERLSGQPDPKQPLDLFSDGAVASALEVAWSAPTWHFDPAQLTPGPRAGARILIELLRRRVDLRARFPHALSEGRAGGFPAWVRAQGLEQFGLPDSFAASVDAAFETDLGAPARKRLLDDPDLRDDEPLFLLPNGRPAACQCLFEAVVDGTLSLEEAWWFLLASAERPLDELCLTWALTPAWQEAVPDGATALGIVALVHWVAETYGITADWLFAQYQPATIDDAQQVRIAYAVHADWRERFPEALSDPTQARSLLRHLSTRASGLPFIARDWAGSRDGVAVAADLPRNGVNILGHFAYPSGLRISTESIVEGLLAADVPVSLRNVPVSASTDEPIGHRFTGIEVFDTTLIHVQPQPLFNVAYPRSGLLPRPARTYRIGYWYWEFDDLPSDWNQAALDCDEIWTATTFIAEGLRKRYRQPVKVLPPGIEIERFDRLPRAHFGLPTDHFLFLFVFHMTSVMDRKNPFGLIKAFRQAFGADEPAALVIKTSFGSEHAEQFAELREAVAEANVTLIDETLSRHETLSLIAACDAYVSLHRSEGLGLTMAEAMLLERPVIATRYSGNLDFMDDDNSLLVDHSLVTLNRDHPPYTRGQRWADPSLAQAAAHMRRLYEDRAFAHALGQHAREDLERKLNYRASGRRMADRLAAIREMP